ncbi:peritrophin-48 [Musca autumnalis]|uniref:peritrophin-48 n=1 Tax=Musca autumnalis TaxID=221902 RepID=UPI003CF26CF0
MGSHFFLTLACVAVLAACSQGLPSKFNMNHLCALVNDGLMISSLDACDAYYECRGGRAIRQICSSGYIFSKEDQICRPQEEVQCAVSSSIPCSGYQVGAWAPVAGSCTDFYYCSQTGPERATCPYGEYFNPLKQACVYPNQYSCAAGSTADSDANVSVEIGSGEDTSDTGAEISITITLPLNLCNFIPSNLFFGSPSDCTGWNKCIDGVMQSGICPNDLEYNVLTMMCEYPQTVTCSQVTNDPFLAPDTCNTKNAKKAGNTCDTYFVCDGSYYQIAECPSGEFYDTVSQTCVDRLQARNNCDRCEGTTNSFVNMYSASNCTGYLYCLNGVEVSSGYCSSGSYFDERVGACVMGASDPLLGCCNPQYYNSSSDTNGSSSTTEASEATTDADVDAKETTVAAEDDATTEADSSSDDESSTDVTDSSDVTTASLTA